jgi:hypothetical protein
MTQDAGVRQEAWRSAVSFTKLADLLSEHYGETITRQRVYEWWKRETRNAVGLPFPREKTSVPDAPLNRPSRDFDFTAVLNWTAHGVPARYGNGWRQLGSRE